MTDLSELLDRVKAATGPDADLDEALHSICRDCDDPQVTGSREAVAWGLLSKDGKVVDANTLRSQFDYLGTSGQVVPLVTLSQLQAVKRERDEAWGARNENAKLKGQRDAALARIKQMQGSNSSMAEGWSALTTRAETAEASLAAAREALSAVGDAGAAVDAHFWGDLTEWEDGPTTQDLAVITSFRAALAGSNG